MISNFFIRRPIFAIVTSIIIVILGFISISGLPVEQYPNITPPMVEVSANYVGADAVTVDQTVATPIAQSVMGVSNMLYMQSTSANDGTMSLQVTFDIGSSPDMNAVFTQNNVSSAEALVPAVVKTQGITTRKAMSSFVMVYSLHCSNGRYDGSYLTNYAMINLQNELLKINGVGQVQVLGAGEYSMRVWINPEMLSFMNLSINDITSAIESQSNIYPSGKLGAAPQTPQTQFTYTVTLPQQINTPQEYENIVIRNNDDGSRLLLKDIAKVEFGSQDYNVSSIYGKDPTAIIVIFQAPGSNAIEVGNSIKSTIADLSERFPEGVTATTVVDATTTVISGIKEILYTLLFALILVVLIIYLFMQDLRALLIPLISIPVSLIGAFILFPLLGFTVNIFSLLGLVLAIGLVVDDAIVVVDAVQVQIQKGLSLRKATIEAMRTVSAPIIATAVVLAAVFIPVSFISGISGLLYQQFAITIVLSVVISAFNALTLSPALCAILLRGDMIEKKGFFGRFNNWFSKRVENYSSFIQTTAKHAARSLIFVLISAGAVIYIMKTLPSGFIPAEDDGYFMISVSLPAAASLERTKATVSKIEQMLLEQSYVKNTSSASGYNMLSGVSSSNSGIIFVSLVDYKERESVFKINEKLNGEFYIGIPEAQVFAFGPPAIPGIGQSSGISLFIQDVGENNNISYIYDNTMAFIEEAIKQPEISSAMTQFDANIPQRHISIDEDRLIEDGISLDLVHQTLASFLGGMYINNFNRFGKLYQTYIQAETQYRQTKEDLNSFFVTNNQGESVPISTYITVKDTVGVEYITAFNLLRSISVMATSSEKYSTSEAMDALQKVADDVLPKDLELAWSGMSYQEKTAAAKGNMTYIYVVVFVFLILAALYESWSTPFTILLGVPFAVFGAALFTYIAHFFDAIYIDNIFMQISLVMIIGLAAKNAILIVQYADMMFFEEKKSLTDAAVGAARLRLRPIIMTSLAFMIGVTPLIFASGADSISRNVMGLALLGGMAASTTIGVFIYPMLYILIGKISSFDKMREKREKESQNEL